MVQIPNGPALGAIGRLHPVTAPCQPPQTRYSKTPGRTPVISPVSRHPVTRHSPDWGLLASGAVIFGVQKLVPTYDNTWYKETLKKPE